MISVIIPTYNRATMVCDCVASVLATNYPALEVIVVDDCSPDDTGSRLAERFGNDARVKVLRNERNSFQAVSRNNGAHIAKGDYLFFLDDDNLVHPEIFTELLAAFDAQPQAGLVAPLAIHRRPGKDGVIWSLGSDFNRWTSQPKDRAPSLPLSKLPQGITEFTTTYSPNAFMVKRKAFNKVGGCDTSFGIMFDESDFGWRIMEAGYEMLISAGARTNHFGFVEEGCVSQLRYLGIEKPRRTYLFARNRLRFARKHFNLPQILSVTFIFAPLSCVYYCTVAIRNRRPDIAWAYLRGTLAGMLGL